LGYNTCAGPWIRGRSGDMTRVQRWQGSGWQEVWIGCTGDAVAGRAAKNGLEKAREWVACREKLAELGHAR
jgi:hypothetical protein